MPARAIIANTLKITPPNRSSLRSLFLRSNISLSGICSSSDSVTAARFNPQKRQNLRSDEKALPQFGQNIFLPSNISLNTIPKETKFAKDNFFKTLG